MSLAFLGRWFGGPPAPPPGSNARERILEPEDAESQFELGRQFSMGNAEDQERAAHWYLKAATQGHPAAQFDLGIMYGQGKGVLRNEVEALTWLRRAAQLGHAGAQYHLGVRLHRASRSPRQPDASESRIESFTWLQLASAQTYRGAQTAREFVTLGMTRHEVDEGNRRALAFVVGPSETGSTVDC